MKMAGKNPGHFCWRLLNQIVIARSAATKQSSLFIAWIASRSLSSGAHSRDPLARNEGLPHNRSSSPAKAKAADPVRRGFSIDQQRLWNTGSPGQAGR
jgi:hypothetical protein